MFRVAIWTACIVGVGLASSPISATAQTPIDSALYRYIRQIRAIDNHTHPVRPTRPDEPPDTAYDALPVGNLPPYSFPARLTADNPEFIAAWKDLFNYPYDDRSEPHVAALLELKAKARAEHGSGYAAWVLDRLGTDIALANRLSVGPGLDRPRFRWVPFADPLLFPFDPKQLADVTPDRGDLVPRESVHYRQYLREQGVGRTPPTLDGYLDQLVKPTLARWKSAGAVAIKYEIAYLRSIAFADVPVARAAAIYERYQGGGAPDVVEYTAFQDYLFREIAKEAGRLGLVVQIHAFDGAGGYFRAAGSDPWLLEPLLTDSSLRGTNFLMIHGGWPSPRHTLSLFGKPNFYADYSFLGNVGSPAIVAGVLREWLTFFPDKVLFGSDAYPDTPDRGWEEWAWLGTTAGRKALAMALTAMMLDGDIDRPGAERLARMVMRENAERLYHF